MGVDRVVNRQLVQLELLGDGDELLLCRLIEGNPSEPVGATAGTKGFPQRTRRRKPVSISVDGAVDDHATLYFSVGVLFLLAPLETIVGTARHLL